MSTDQPVLALDAISVHYGSAQAVERVSLEVTAGEVVCLLGANGAGKSSTLKGAAVVVPVSRGQVLLRGKDISTDKPWKIAAAGLSYVPQNRRCFAGMSVEENLRMGAVTQPKDVVDGRLQQVYDLFPVLADKRRQGATTLSGGQQQMLAIGRGIISHPTMLLLDEPSLGLSPKIVGELGGWINEIVTELGMSVLLVEQNFLLAQDCASRGYLMSQGSVVSQGTTAELADRVKGVYLGEAAS
jgi:branched-chain amino acid transport system ATP-binding protein